MKKTIQFPKRAYLPVYDKGVIYFYLKNRLVYEERDLKKIKLPTWLINWLSSEKQQAYNQGRASIKNDLKALLK